MLDELEVAEHGQHASNLGALLAHYFAKRWQVPAFIVDPPVVDEMEPEARLSGVNGIERRSRFHALNQKAVANLAAKKMGKEYSQINIVVAHLGGGISVAAHRQGRVIDVNNAADGDGPMSPERSGTVPAGDLVRLCFSEQDVQKILHKLVGQGGLTSYLGTTDAREVRRRMEAGDDAAKLAYRSLAHQVIKAIGGCAAVLRGQVNAVVLTGGLAHDTVLVSWLKDSIEFIAPVMVYPGEREMEALADGALRAVRGEQAALHY